MCCRSTRSKPSVACTQHTPPPTDCPAVRSGAQPSEAALRSLQRRPCCRRKAHELDRTWSSHPEPRTAPQRLLEHSLALGIVRLAPATRLRVYSPLAQLATSGIPRESANGRPFTRESSSPASALRSSPRFANAVWTDGLRTRRFSRFTRRQAHSQASSLKGTSHRHQLQAHSQALGAQDLTGTGCTGLTGTGCTGLTAGLLQCCRGCQGSATVRPSALNQVRWPRALHRRPQVQPLAAVARPTTSPLHRRQGCLAHQQLATWPADLGRVLGGAQVAAELQSVEPIGPSCSEQHPKLPRTMCPTPQRWFGRGLSAAL